MPVPRRRHQYADQKRYYRVAFKVIVDLASVSGVLPTRTPPSVSSGTPTTPVNSPQRILLRVFSPPHTLPEARVHSRQRQRAEHFNIAHDRDTDGDDCDESTSAPQKPKNRRASLRGRCRRGPAEFSAREEAGEGEHGGENNKKTRSDGFRESVGAKNLRRDRRR